MSSDRIPPPPPPSQPDPAPGLACPQCGCRHLPVYYTRRRSKAIVRVRYCRHCGRRIVTREKA